MKILIKLMAIAMVLAFVSTGCDKKPADPPADAPKADEAKKDGDKPAAEKKDEAPAADEKKAEAPAADEKKDGATCAALSTKITDLLKEQGDKAMLKPTDVPMLTKGCEKGKTLEANKEDVECVMKTADLKGMGECKGANQMLKDMMKNAE